QRLLLEVRAGNTAAQALYAAHGFSIAGRRKNYYRATDGQTEDAVLMEKICYARATSTCTKLWV
ncbi:hypothetical protein MM710_39410, partial [Klebsiella pneumoniae]|nr:hypothetical protein [Klebsiella pneumoniae]